MSHDNFGENQNIFLANYLTSKKLNLTHENANKLHGVEIRFPNRSVSLYLI
jgi:hypothetical protein